MTLSFKGPDYKDIKKRRAIIDRAALAAEVMAFSKNSLPSGREAVTDCLRKAMENGRQEIRQRLEKGKIRGITTAHATSFLMDQIMHVLFEWVAIQTTEGQRASPHVALVAVGGYGRGELAPYSDVDLMFLTTSENKEAVEAMSNHILYSLWDMGLKVGHTIRTLDEVIQDAREDLTIQTSLLDARFLCGTQSLFSDAISVFAKKIMSGRGRAFVEGKLAERDKRHIRMGDTRYVVEPNIKEGKGGLRDLHTLFWIARFLYGVDDFTDLRSAGILTAKETREFKRAQDFLWTVRFYLHFTSGRAEERLTFDMQLELSKRLHYKSHPGSSGVERFMKHYYLTAKNVGDLTRVFCAYLEARHKKESQLPFPRFGRAKNIEGFILENNRLSVSDEKAFRENPLNILRIYAVAEETGYDIHPNALTYISRSLGKIDRSFRRDKEANRLFMDILTSRKNPELSLRRMNESGVFGRFIPDFGRIVAQTQHDMYHHFTVDEHTIRAIGLLSSIERGGQEISYALASRLISRINARKALYVAVLLHDIAKGRGGDHSEIGADIALKLCPRLGFDAGDTELVSWLVRYHLLMSHTAFKRDLSDPKTIRDFVGFVKSPERLRLLYILTVVDISAVGPGVWNDWKGQLLEDLYAAAIEMLVAGHKRIGRAETVRQRLLVLKSGLPRGRKTAVTYMSKLMPEAYWIAEDPDVQSANAVMIDKARKANQTLAVEVDSDTDWGATRISIYTRDMPGIFNKLAGAMAVLGAEVVDAKIHTMGNGMVVDNFLVRGTEGRTFEDPHKLRKVEDVITGVLDGRVHIEKELSSRRREKRQARAFPVAPFVVIDNSASNHHTVIEVNAQDRLGLLYDLTKAFLTRNVSVQSAHIATYGERAVDVFYVQERDGRKITNGRRLKALRGGLITAAGQSMQKGR